MYITECKDKVASVNQIPWGSSTFNSSHE